MRHIYFVVEFFELRIPKVLVLKWTYYFKYEAVSQSIAYHLGSNWRLVMYVDKSLCIILF